MKLDPMTRAHARRALREAVQNHLFDPNVALIDLGHPEHEGKIAWDEIALRVHVRKKLVGAALEAAAARGYTRPVPPAIQGFPTDVPEARYHLQRMGWVNPGPAHSTDPRRRREVPMQGGISISDAYHNAAGTLGGVVADRVTGEQMILSNWHVLVSDWGKRVGQPICQPGRFDGGSFGDTVARLTRDAMNSNLDAAVATVDGERALVNDQLDLGPVTGATSPEIDMEVVKSGRTTGITHGIVEGLDGSLTLPYGSLMRIIHHVVTIGPLNFGALSGNGDSGSIWLEAQTGRAVGMHFAGNDYPARALALDMPSVLDALNVDLLKG